MSTKTQAKKTVAETFDAARDAALKEIDKVAAPVKEDDGKLGMKNQEGKMLMCRVTIGSREGGPDPICYTVNDEIKWIKRNKEVIIPWYFVLHMKNNIETRFRQEKDEQGKRIVVPHTGPSEPVSYSTIDAHPDNPKWL